ncbi:MAG: nitroreductase family protein [Desulforegulaceae bacterium]|nr:nitroreductase family protein [Desulforegulaceae bacterium]
MSVSIDHDKCVLDFKCIDECPVKIFGFSKEEKKITIIPAPESLCIKCGHCMAVCPEGAIKVKGFTDSDFIEKNKNEILSKENIEYILRSRRSIRSYKNEIVPKEKIEELLNLGFAAPTGHNSRSVNFTIVYEKEKLKTFSQMVIDWMKYMIKEQPDTAALLNLNHVVMGFEAGFDGIFRGAPHLIIAHSSKYAPTAAIDCATAISYLEVGAQGLGLGTCWAGFFNVAASFWPPLKSELNLPKDHKNHGTIMVGVPKHEYKKIIKRKPGNTTWI